MKKCILPLLLLASFIPAFAIDGNGTIVSGGINRSFVYHAPGNGQATGLPLLIVFHGTGGSGAGIKGYSGFDAVADAGNFIVVYPNAVAIDGTVQWNVYVDDQPGHGGLPGGAGAPDDIMFTRDLVSYFCDNFGIDPVKVYAAGHSNGGFMCYNLAVQATDLVAAVAPVAANMWGDNAFITDYFTNAFAPISVYHIHGDNDGTVGYPDPNHQPDFDYPLSSFSYGNCNLGGYTVNNIVANVDEHVYCDGSAQNGEKVILIRLIGGGHGWPSIQGYNAPQAIWNFLKDYSLGNSPLACSNNVGLENMINDNGWLVYPNPVKRGDNIYISATTQMDISAVKVIDMSGRQMQVNILPGSDLNVVQILSGNLVPGVYVVNYPGGSQKITVME